MSNGSQSVAARSRAGHHRRTLVGAAVVASCLPGAALIGAGLLRQPGAVGIDLCIVHRMTGFWCPLCGGTRATRALLLGDVSEALGYNPFALVVLALGVILIARWLLSRRAGRSRPLISGWEMVTVFAASALFGVVRNLPGMWVHLGPLLGPPG